MTTGAHEPARTRWAEIRARGRIHFLVHYGLLRFALPMAVLMVVYSAAVEPLLWGEPLPDRAYLTSPEFARLLLVALVIWPPAGYLWAAWTWRSQERAHRRERRE